MDRRDQKNQTPSDSFSKLEPEADPSGKEEPVQAEFVEEEEEIVRQTVQSNSSKSQIDLANEVKTSVINLATRYADEGSVVKASIGVGLAEAISFGLSHLSKQNLK